MLRDFWSWLAEVVNKFRLFHRLKQAEALVRELSWRQDMDNYSLDHVWDTVESVLEQVSEVPYHNHDTDYADFLHEHDEAADLAG